LRVADTEARVGQRTTRGGAAERRDVEVGIPGEARHVRADHPDRLAHAGPTRNVNPTASVPATSVPTTPVSSAARCPTAATGSSAPVSVQRTWPPPSSATTPLVNGVGTPGIPRCTTVAAVT